MSARGHSSDRSSIATSLASGSTIRTRHQYSSSVRAKEATQTLHNLVNAASTNSFYESQVSLPEARPSHLTVVNSSPFFCPERQTFAKRNESELDLELRTNAASSTRTGSISDDDEDFFTPAAEFPVYGGAPRVPEARNMPTAVPIARPKTPTLDPADIKAPSVETPPPPYRPTSSSQINDPPSNSTFRDGGSSFCSSSQRSGHSAQTYLRSLAETARTQRKVYEKEELAAKSEIASVVSQGNSPSIPAVSDSYIHRNDYVNKPRWGLSTEELAKNAQQNTAPNYSPDAEQIRKQHMARNPYVKNESVGVPKISQMSSANTQTLDTQTRDSKVSAFVASTLGHHMDKLSMDKVFNDPSFRGIYNQYNKQTGKPLNTTKSAPSVRHSIPDDTAPRKPDVKPSEVIKEQIPAHLAILDADIVALLTPDILKNNPLLAQLHSACFRRRTNGSIECLSIMDLGLEKKDHEFLTSNWAQLARMTERCQRVYSLINNSGCGYGQFSQNIMAFMRHAVNQGLELAILLVKTATFVVIRDGDPVDLLNYVHHLRQLSDALNSNCEFIETVRVALSDNFTAIPMIQSGMRLDLTRQMLGLPSNKNTETMCPDVTVWRVTKCTT